MIDQASIKSIQYEVANVESRIDGSFWRHQWFHKNSFKNKKSERKEKKKLVPLIILLLKTNVYFCSPQQLGRRPYSKAIPLLREIFTRHVFVFCAKEKETVTDQNEQIFDYYTFHNSSGTLLNKCKFSAKSKMVAINIFIYRCMLCSFGRYPTGFSTC